MFRIRFVLLFAAVAPIVSLAQPRVGGLVTCTTSNLSGTFAYAISGFTAGAGGSAVPFADHGSLAVDGSGSFAGTSLMSNGGAIASRDISGTLTVNANCSGSATLSDTLGNVYSLAITVTSNGNEIQFMETDAGTAMSGTAQRVSTGCDSASFSGPYTYAIRGWLAAGGSYQPFADSGRIVANGNGSLTGKSTNSAAGIIGRRTFSGSYSLDSNCNGRVTLVDNLGNHAALTVTVVNNGQAVVFSESDSGTIISGRAYRGQFACTNSVLAGPYSYSIDGYVLNSTTLYPLAISGLITADGGGRFAGADTISQGGIVNSRTTSGSYSIKTDCSGNAVLTDAIGNSLNLDFFVADNGSRIEFIQSDATTVLSGGAQMQGGSCSISVINGSYGYTIAGFTTLNSRLVPFTDAGQLIANGTNSFSGSSTASLNLSIIGRSFSGTFQVSSNCTGSVSFRDNFGTVANLRFTASADGQRLDFIETDAGTIISGTAQREQSRSQDAIVNAASFAAGTVVPGALFSIFGDNFAPGISSAGTTPLPTQLGNTSVLVNGKAIPVYYVSPGQINAQLPILTAPGSAQLVVSTNGRSSAPVSFTVVRSGPGIFTYGLSRAVAVNPNGVVNGPSSAARSGDTLVVYLTGCAVAY